VRPGTGGTECGGRKSACIRPRAPSAAVRNGRCSIRALQAVVSRYPDFFPAYRFSQSLTFPPQLQLPIPHASLYAFLADRCIAAEFVVSLRLPWRSHPGWAARI